MITARNYAAEAERDLKTLLVTAPSRFGKVIESDRSTLRELISLISDSQKFALPDRGFLLEDGLKGLKDVQLKLPYPTITIEYFDDRTKVKVLIVATHATDCIQVYALVNQPGQTGWLPSTKRIHFKEDSGNFIEDVYHIRKIDINIIFFLLNGITDLKAAQESHLRMSDIATDRVLNLLEALSCRNVYTESLGNFNHKKKNDKLIKAGKLPLYETKILVVDSAPKTVDKTDLGGTHASPRQHLRRGHIRRYPTYSIWINNTIVGKASNGRIDKSYEVK